MSRPKSPVYHSLSLFAICLLLMSTLSACSGGGSSEQSNGTDTTSAPTSTTGGVAFQLTWQNPSSGARALLAPPFNACLDFGITTIAATVSDGTTTITNNSWPCSEHRGLILGVPAGTNFTLQVTGISSGLATIWSGSASPITVTAGQITNAGTIVMGYVGTDNIRPTVTNIIPYTWNFGSGATTAPVTDRFTVAFSEPMAISTMTSANITLKLIDNTPVPGIVSYDGASNTAAIIPSATLASNTQYVVQVISCITTTFCITDLAGNRLLSDYTNTFTTEPLPVGAPGAPSGVTATPGNGQVRLDWPATSGATSYNVYYGTAPGVTTTNGTRVLDVRAPFVHIGLNNGTAYYYIVTAVNSFGESPASVEVSATPVFPAGSPSPPASLAAIFNSGQNNITWAPVTGATSYNLYWSTRPIFPDHYSADNVIRDVTSPYAHAGLTDGLPYCYIVTALDPTGESADSMQVCGGFGAIQVVW